MTGQTSIQQIRAFYELWNERKFDEGARQVTPDAQWVDVSTGMTHRGPEGFKQSGQLWATAFPDGKIEIKNVVVSGNMAVVEFIGRGTHSGPLQTPQGQIPATNKRIELAFCDVLHLKDGKFAGSRSYYDAAGLQRQLGLARAA